MILDSNGLGKEISDTVERVYRRLSGLEHPAPLPQSLTVVSARPEATREREDDEKSKEAETPKPSARKRTFGEISMQDGSVSADKLMVTPEKGVASGSTQS